MSVMNTLRVSDLCDIHNRLIYDTESEDTTHTKALVVTGIRRNERSASPRSSCSLIPFCNAGDPSLWHGQWVQWLLRRDWHVAPSVEQIMFFSCQITSYVPLATTTGLRALWFEYFIYFTCQQMWFIPWALLQNYSFVCCIIRIKWTKCNPSFKLL